MKAYVPSWHQIITKRFENTLSSLSTVKYGKKREELGRNLTILREELARRKTTTAEDRVYDEYFSQLLYAEGTLKHVENLLKAYAGDSERELKRTLKANNEDIDAYHCGSTEGNHCMYFGEYGDKLMGTMKKPCSNK